jgi:tetratricopeptide (TPR) repeat protein
VVASLSKAEVLKQLETNDTFVLRVRAAELFAADGDTTNAATHYTRALELFPYVVGDGNPYEAFAKLLEQKGNAAQAADVLEKLVSKDENNLAALQTIARLRSSLGQRQQALEALLASFYISPFDYKLHTQAGELSVELKNYPQALAAAAKYRRSELQCRQCVSRIGPAAGSQAFRVTRARSRAALRKGSRVVVENSRTINQRNHGG